jgi:hypothetical protein
MKKQPPWGGQRVPPSRSPYLPGRASRRRVCSRWQEMLMAPAMQGSATACGAANGGRAARTGGADREGREASALAPHHDSCQLTPKLCRIHALQPRNLRTPPAREAGRDWQLSHEQASVSERARSVLPPPRTRTKFHITINLTRDALSHATQLVGRSRARRGRRVRLQI